MAKAKPKSEGKTKISEEAWDLIIVGGGCVGLAGAMYAGRLEMKTLVLADSVGGVITTTDVVENYPGFKRLTGQELIDKLKEHALDYKRFVEIKDFSKVTKVERKGENACFKVATDEATYMAKTVIFATGSKWRELRVPGHDEFRNKGVSYCALCLPPEESVIANSSILEIGKTTPMTRVLTGEGIFKPIGGFTNTPHSGKLVKIKTRLFREPVLLTPNHPVYALNVIKGQGQNYWKDFKFTEPEWVEAGSLKEGQCVLYPIPKEVEDRESIQISEFLEVDKQDDGRVLPKRATVTANPVPDEIKVDLDFLRLVGYYLAEGSSSRHTLAFYFNKKEAEYIEDVKSILKRMWGFEPHSYERENISAVCIYAKAISDFFKALFSNHAPEKSLPHWIMILPPEKQKEIIKGMWRGDGCVREKDFCYVTSSRQLAYQMRDLLLRQGILPSIERRKRDDLNKKEATIEGRKVYFNHDKYHVYVSSTGLESMEKILGISHPYASKRSSVQNQAWLKDGFAVLPIKSIELVDYEGPVISVGVPDSNTFVAKNFVVHNCDGALFKNKVVAVVGGSDSAAKEALVLSRYARKVYIIYRGEEIHPEPVNYERVKATKNIEIVNKTNVTKVIGDKFVTAVELDNTYKGSKKLELDGIFVSIGHIPNSDLAALLGVKLNEKKEIVIDRASHTNVPGVFAAGDVVDTEFKQAITGVGEVVSAVYSAYKYISEKTIVCM